MKKIAFFTACVLAITTTTSAYGGLKTRLLIGGGAIIAEEMATGCAVNPACERAIVALGATAVVAIARHYGFSTASACFNNTNCRNELINRSSANSEPGITAKTQKDVPGPPGDCNQDEYGKLTGDVTRFCKGFSKGELSCKNGDGIAELQDQMKRATDCLNARMKRENYCFRGGDKGHKVQMSAMLKAAQKCGKILMQSIGR